MQVSEQTEFSQRIAEELRRLLPQLSNSAAMPSDEFIRKLLASDSSRLLVARDGDSVVGFLTLVIFPIPTGVRAWIEDVIVDSAARGKGVGEKLNRAALDLAKNLGARTVELTSRPSREAANRLYQRLGFVPRDTNVYRFMTK
jgi:ribosomal protein S18 acetylase RimI-like enzyme